MRDFRDWTTNPIASSPSGRMIARALHPPPAGGATGGAPPAGGATGGAPRTAAPGRFNRGSHRVSSFVSTFTSLDAFAVGSKKEQPQWCRGGSVLAVVAVVLAQTILVLIFALNCTPVPDLLSGEEESRERWLNITMTVTVIVGLLVVLGVIYGVYVLCRITCFWEAEVRKERRLRVHPEEYVGEDEGASGHQISLLAAWTRVLSYWFGSRGPNYYQLQFLLEVLELVTQLLALERYSTTGMTKSFLGVYSGIILANAMTPLLFVYIIHDQHKHNNLQRLGVWTRRLLLVDCFCDVCYSLYPLVYLLLVRLPQIQSAAVCDASPFSRCGDSRAYLMLSVSAEVLLGGTTVWDVAIKIVTRLVPLLIALEKARVAFLLAYVVDAVDNVKTAERLPTIVQQQHAHEKEEDTAEKEEDEEDEEESGPARVDESLPQRRRSSRLRRAGLVLSPSGQRRFLRNSLKRASLSNLRRKKGYYKPVPWLLAVSVTLAIVIVCTAVWIRLALWTPCPMKLVKETCTHPTFPIFSGEPRETEGCACSTFLSKRPHGTCLGSSRDQNKTGNNISSLANYARHPVTLRYTQVMFLTFQCQTDIAENLANFFGRCSPDFLQVLAVHGVPAPANATLSTRPLPKTIGNLKGLVSLSLFYAYVNGYEDPSAWGALTRLKELRIHDNPSLGYIPDELAQLPMLRRLTFSLCGLTSIPPALLATYRQMDAVRFDWNRITEVPNAISKLNLQDLGLNGNLLVALPETLYDIRRLRNLHLAFNNITVLSPALGKVTTLKRLMVQYNRLSQLPEGLAFPRLEHITLNNNSLTSQLSILSGWSVPSLERLDLESNLIEGPFSTSIAADAPNRLVGDAKPTQVFLGHNNFCAARPGSVESVVYNSTWNVTWFCTPNYHPNCYPHRVVALQRNGDAHCPHECNVAGLRVAEESKSCIKSKLHWSGSRPPP